MMMMMERLVMKSVKLRQLIPKRLTLSSTNRSSPNNLNLNSGSHNNKTNSKKLGGLLLNFRKNYKMRLFVHMIHQISFMGKEL